jgi:hypothetical protein
LELSWGDEDSRAILLYIINCCYSLFNLDFTVLSNICIGIQFTVNDDHSGVTDDEIGTFYTDIKFTPSVQLLESSRNASWIVLSWHTAIWNTSEWISNSMEVELLGNCNFYGLHSTKC